MTNKSKVLKDTEKCRMCGKCCRYLTMFFDDHDGFISRLRLLKTDAIKVERNGMFDNGMNRYKVTFLSPCRELSLNEGIGWRCNIYNQPRPLMCELYPYQGEDNECPKDVK